MKIAAVIITYNPSIDRLKENLRSLAKQVEKLFIIDNHSDNFSEIKSIFVLEHITNVFFIRFNKNEGLAFALQKGLVTVEKHSFEWVITMDQDSILNKNYVTQCKRFLNKPENKNIGMICPNVIDTNLNRNYADSIRRFEMNDGATKILECITSGSFLNVSIGIEVGGFDQELFIDQVDYDMCFKLRKNKYEIYRLMNSTMLHELGDSKKHKIFGLSFQTTNHSPFRLYYIYRNYLILRKRYKVLRTEDKDVKKWFNKQLLRHFYRPIKIFLAEKYKIKKFTSICKGIKAGVYHK